jgi:hypothetical protein
LSELATWRAASPYRSVNLYIGGRLHACPDRQPTKDQIAAASDQGWTFIPTWVGLQAPCSPYPSNSFSYNPGEAFNQGVAEADAAIEAARRLGLAQDDGSGTIIYYNMEAYDGSNEGCVAAAQAFIAGWSGRLRARGSQAGLYGLACNPPMGRYAGSSSPPDAVWMAGWNRDFFDAEMTVWDIFCVSDTLWARSQRIRQYTGGHDETWGGVTLNIDSNVLDSIVADLDAAPPATPTPTPTPTATPTPQPTVVLETARLDPPYADGMCGAGWHLLVNDRGYPTYLAANRDRHGTIPPGAEELSAAWEPVIPTDGFYRVEAYIPDHGIMQWLCPEARLVQDTASAYYTVRHAEGTTIKVGNQGPLRNGWLLLGVYPFRAGQTASVTLSTATDEAAYTRTVAASALRLMRLENGAAGSHFLYLPQLNNRR